MIRDLQKELARLLLPPKAKKSYKYSYEIIYHEPNEEEQKTIKTTSKKAIERKEKDLVARGCEVVAVECWRADNEGSEDLIWSH